MVISQVRFKWTKDNLVNLLKCLREFKSSMEFRNFDSNADKFSLYESVRKSLADICKYQQGTFRSSLDSENLYNDLGDVSMRLI